MQAPRLETLLSFCFWIAVAANAQTAAPDGAGEHNARPGAAEPRESSARTATDSSSICQVIAAAAAANGLPFEFFAQIIWQESRFKPDAVGPITRSGQRAQGIAQFMPATATERVLHDPFDPIEALPKSAEFLRELRAQFGNLGLAAAAYNAGPQRVRDWLAGKRGLPSQTQAYVRAVTGRSVEMWARLEQAPLPLTISGGVSCTDTAKLVSKPKSPAIFAAPSATSAWAVQLVGDRSETKALTLYRQLQNKHEALLKSYEPTLVRTTLKVGAAPIWTRVRIDADTRQAAEYLCSRLRASGDDCLVQRN
jgi:hypothetical protein